MGLLTDRNKEMHGASVLCGLSGNNGIILDSVLLSPDEDRSKREYIARKLSSITGQIIDSLPHVEELTMLLNRISSIDSPFDIASCMNLWSEEIRCTYSTVHNSIHLNKPNEPPSDQSPLNDYHVKVFDMMQDINKNQTWRSFFSLPRHGYIGVAGVNISRSFRQDMSSKIFTVFYMYIRFAAFGLGSSLGKSFDSRHSMFTLTYEYIPELWGF